MNNFFALLVTFALSLVWLRINDYAAHRGWVSSDLSRKLIHIGTGPLFVACWLLFRDTPSARWLAALVPFAITAQFFLVGAGYIRDESAVKAMSRTGDRSEILRGPLFYGVVFVIMTLVYWYNSPIGIIALMLMCGGDGLADIIGRRFGKTRLPWNKGKSIAGSLGMLVGGFFTAAVIVALYVFVGRFPQPYSFYLLPLAVIALAGTVVESLPFRDIDNISVTFTAVVLGHLVFVNP